MTSFEKSLCSNRFTLPQVTTFYKHQYNASNRNWCIDLGKDGYVYIGNDMGLMSFDGVNWTLNELPARSKIRSVCVGSDGLIYTGSAEEIGYWKRDKTGRLNYISLKDRLVNVTFHNQEIWRIFEDADKNIVFQGFSLTLRYDGQRVKKVEVDSPPNLMVEYDNRLWGSTRQGILLELTGYGYQKILQSPQLKQARLKGIFPYADNQALLMTRTKGLFIWEENTLSPWQCEANERLINEDINCATYHNGFYYIGTINSGLLIVNSKGHIVHEINSQNHLQDNTILSLQLDEYDRLWFTMSVGLGYLELNSPIKFLIDANKRIGAVHSVTHHKGRFYIASNKGVWCKPFAKGEQLVSFDDFKLLPDLKGLAWSLKVVDDHLLCGHNRGTYIINKENVRKISNHAGGRSFQKLKVQGKNYLILNSYTNLVVLEQGKHGSWRFKTTVEGFSEPTMSVAVDHKDQLWLQHDRKSELYNIRLQQNLKDAYSYNVYDAENGLPQDMKSEVYEFKNRIIITSSKGMFTYDGLKDSIVKYDQLNAQLGKFSNAHKIIEQDANHYWLIRNNHLALFRIEDGTATKQLQYRFSEPHMGLVEDFENIINIDSIGTFIGMENGVGMIGHGSVDDLKAGNSAQAFKINVTLQYKTGDRIVISSNPHEGTIDLPYNYKDLELTAASLASPGKRMEYRLELISETDSTVHHGYNNSFKIDSSDDRYELRIQAFDQWGQPALAKHIEVSVLKPWYLSNGFIMLWSVCFLVVMSVLVLRFKRNLKRYLNEVPQESDSLQSSIELSELKDIKSQLEDEVIQQNNHIATGALNAIRNKEVLSNIKKELTAQKEKLGIRYPDKYYKKLIDLIESNIHTEDDWILFERHFDKANNNFVSRLKAVYPQLTPRDLRLCAYLKMNLSSREIAPLLDISERSVEVHRYRLRKKLDLPAESNLSEFMISF
ncbi:LuxR C-terminal-related transcriptional regulator [Carboxylicivirga sp. RSCT41]|uniref:helix-turn-helix and ligand-binding sensor domain-containing protein n=1 Tax=Carboxylicivirga agarovorans TaxID=3417570 RepID=UPI003D33A164